ncbi:MBL fold metallo-hydrolase [Acinetobacter courvalinii]|uniref:MBL fold metallo-hydrolase n=1 Tax=Acinetobacter courvalinii TaxID=280147 RepID=UPI0021D092F7|nr:MBL fold metallo-hydrolase [Acinetobacter courvalinii]MCU4578452.1 MBL fold metallo-hydrolase [Acinetobacter courvalinii]
MIKKRYKFALIIVIVGFGIFLTACATLNKPQFGQLPEQARLERIKQSPNYKNEEFVYPVATPMLRDGESTLKIFWDNFWAEKQQTKPNHAIPSVKTDLHALDQNQDVVIWLGHSAYYIQLAGKRILIDPVLSNHAAPFSFLIKAFDGTTIYQAKDIPEIDYLLISHDHYDHLDYATVTQLKDKVKHVVVPLGVGAHFEHWGYPLEKIHENDWFDTLTFAPSLKIHTLPARHYSGRLFTRNKALWASYALETPKQKIYFGGDSGYGSHFKTIGEKFGGFDVVMLDSGQYDPRWPLIHMTPEEAVKAAVDLKAKVLMPMHIGRFSLSPHAWDEPFKRVVKASENAHLALATPIIGQPIWLNKPISQFPYWWERLK